MRPLREVYSDITNLKCRKEIQKAYDAVRDRYQAVSYTHLKSGIICITYREISQKLLV